MQHQEDAKIHSYSGVDIKAGVLIPQYNSLDANRNITQASMAFKTWAELQTISISSERPAGPVRVLGVAAPRDHVRGVRTIAGSMIFSVLDKDVFYDLYKSHDREAPADYPMFVDMIPPFHVVLSAQNEYGNEASCAIVGITLTNFGTTFSIDDLMIEATYSYVAKFVHPFMNRTKWRNELYDSWNKDGGSRFSHEGPPKDLNIEATSILE